jgi:SAM-dependent methyltransferase
MLHPMNATELTELLGKIDIYLLDQILRGRVPEGARILDAGCGPGRNLVFLVRAGYDVSAVDENPEAIASVRELARHLEPTQFRVEPVERLSFPHEAFDFVIASAVLHFARDEGHFESMLKEMWRVLAPGGILFARLASTIGMEDRMQLIEGRRFTLPDGTDRYLVDEALLMALTGELGATLLDPIKTTVVQNQRCMTTWVIGKPAQT